MTVPLYPAPVRDVGGGSHEGIEGSPLLPASSFPPLRSHPPPPSSPALSLLGRGQPLTLGGGSYSGGGGGSIISTGSNTVLATIHVPPGVGIILRNVQFGGFVVLSPLDPQFLATRGRVLWCTLVPPQTPLLDYRMSRYYGWITPREKQSSGVSKVAPPKKGNQAWSGNDDSDTEDAVHWTCACQQVHYADNSHAAHDAFLLI